MTMGAGRGGLSNVAPYNIYIYMHLHVHIYMYTYVYTYIYIYTHMHLQIHLDIHVVVYINIRAIFRNPEWAQARSTPPRRRPFPSSAEPARMRKQKGAPWEA